MIAQDIINKIEVFISEQDTSIKIANEIEVIIDDNFEEDEFLQETVEMLAMYRPGGGDFLFDIGDIKNRLVETREYLKRLVN